MITGHFAVGYLAGATLRDRRLLWLCGASFAPDIVDAAFALAGRCNAYGAYSHSLPALAVLAPLSAAICWMVTRDRRYALAAALLTISHLGLDMVSGQKAILVTGPLIGLSLYQWPAVDFVLETVLMALVWGWARVRLGHGVRWVRKYSIVLLLALQCLCDVLIARDIQAVRSSQSKSCRAGFQQAG